MREKHASDYEDKSLTGHIMTGFFYTFLEVIGYILLLAFLLLVVLMLAH